MGSPENAMDHVLVGGLRIGFRHAGHGPPLMLLHGGLGDSRVWRDQLEDLSDEFTVGVGRTRLRGIVGPARHLPPG